MAADPRWKDLRFSKILPVLFVLTLILSLVIIYLAFHLIPLLREGGKDKHHHKSRDAWIQLVFFLFFTIFLCISYFRAVVTHPGTVPESSPDGSVDWILRKYSPDTDPELVDMRNEPLLQESKRNGRRRRCKYCAEFKRAAVQYKPDRTHHCKLCEMCILKMDHHCPWIHNCVGFKNHKYFMLTVFYSALDTMFIFFTMWTSVEASVDTETESLSRFWLVFGQTITALLACVVIIFLYFHVWLMVKAMTTIEFCEKQRTRGYDVSIYDRGWYGNIEASLGPSPLLWLMPCSPPLGDGLSFSQTPTERTPLGHCGSTARAATSSGQKSQPAPQGSSSSSKA